MSRAIEVPIPFEKSTGSADRTEAVADVPTAKPPTRIPMTTFGIAFGLAGLAGTWSLAAGTLGAPEAVAAALWAALTAVARVWLIVAHAVRGRRSAERLIDQLRNPTQGPVAAGFIAATTAAKVGLHGLALITGAVPGVVYRN
jgi:hypothetical protein